MIQSPLPLGPFLVDESGRLAFRRPDIEPGFSFLWRGRCFAVRLRAGALSCSVPIGRLPSTAAGGGKREAGMALLRVLIHHLPRGWRLRLLPDHRIQIDTEQPMALPTTIGTLLSPVVGLLLRAAPLLDLMDENELGSSSVGRGSG
jgi:hypothetical protein